MELGWGALVLLVLAAAAVWFLQDSLAARERANAAAMEACRRLSLQFLDGTVAFARLSFVREQGQLAIRRTYVFDYTANSIERRQGFVILLGHRVEAVGYAPDEERRAQAPAPAVSLSARFEPTPAEPAAAPQLLNTVHLVQRSVNDQLGIDGVLLTMYDARLNLSRQVATEAREYFGNKVFETVIPRNVRLAEAPSFGKPIILYDVASVGAQAYMSVAKELLERHNNGASAHLPDSASA